MTKMASMRFSSSACTESPATVLTSVVLPPGSMPLQGQRMRAAAFLADVQALALEIRQQGSRFAAIKDHQRLVGNAAQRDELAGVRTVDLAAQDEAHVDGDPGVGQLLDVVDRPFGWKDGQRDAFAGQNLLVFLGVVLKDTAGGPADDGDGGGRGGIDEEQSGDAYRQADEQNHAHRYDQPPTKDRTEFRQRSGNHDSWSEHANPPGNSATPWTSHCKPAKRGSGAPPRNIGLPLIAAPARAPVVSAEAARPTAERRPNNATYIIRKAGATPDLFLH